jgi:hypothetical protein
MPLDAPVTTATLPFSLFMAFSPINHFVKGTLVCVSMRQLPILLNEMRNIQPKIQ